MLWMLFVETLINYDLDKFSYYTILQFTFHNSQFGKIFSLLFYIFLTAEIKCKTLLHKHNILPLGRHMLGRQTWPDSTFPSLSFVFGFVSSSVWHYKDKNKWMHPSESKHVTTSVKQHFAFHIYFTTFSTILFIYVSRYSSTAGAREWDEEEREGESSENGSVKVLFQKFHFPKENIILICIRMVNHSWSCSQSITLWKLILKPKHENCTFCWITFHRVNVNIYLKNMFQWCLFILLTFHFSVFRGQWNYLNNFWQNVCRILGQWSKFIRAIFQTCIAYNW